uniref:Uncharacterized protein n=1 Tax=Anopheles arabiensis TaxID=7173 RepID=A0A182IHH2_ANOAR
RANGKNSHNRNATSSGRSATHAFYSVQQSGGRSGNTVASQQANKTEVKEKKQKKNKSYTKQKK